MLPGGNSKVRYALRYTPGTALAERFGSAPTQLLFHSREDAEQMRAACANSDSMDVVEVHT